MPADVTYNTAGVEYHGGDLLYVVHDVDIAANGDTLPVVGLRSVLMWGSDKPASVTGMTFAYAADGTCSATIATTGAVTDVKLWFAGFP